MLHSAQRPGRPGGTSGAVMQCSRLLLPFLATALTLATNAAAVTNIRYERWETSAWVRRDAVAPVDSMTSMLVIFDATSTAADAVQGFRFALAERTGGGNRILLRIAGRPCAGFPAPGSNVLLSLRCSFYCDAAGRLYARDRITWNASWCTEPSQSTCGAVNVPPAAPPGSADAELFELVLLDESDVEGANPTPEDALQAEPPGSGFPPLFHFEAPDFAPSGTIGLFKDPGGNLCSDFIQPFVPFRWYVVMRFDGMTRCGFTTLEMGIHGLPPGVFVNVTPNPHAYGLWGDPFGAGFLGFPCERGDGSAIVLYTLDGVSSVPLQDAEITVGAASPPSNFLWPYPWVNLCPDSGAGRRRMLGQTFVVNPSPGHACDTTVRVTRITWTAIKSLFREPAPVRPR